MPPATHETTLFASPGRIVTLVDVLHAAELRGDLPSEITPRARLDDAAAESASEDWRVGKDLIAGEELDVWLAQRHITHDDFLRHFRGDAPATDAQRHTAWWIEGSISQMAARQAHAIAALAAQSAPPTECELAAWTTATVARLGGEAALHDWLHSHQRDAVWLADLAQIETAYERCRADLLQAPSLAKELRTQHFALHRVTLTVCQVPAEGTARELMLQLRENTSITLSQHAEGCGFPHFPQQFFIGDLEPAYQQPFLSARTGECLPPMRGSDHWRVCQLVEKTAPDLEDAEVLSRVQKRVMEQGFAERCEGVIIWCVE